MKRAHRGGEGEGWRSVGFKKKMYLQNLQIAQRSESSIFDAADVVAVQLPAPQTHASATQKCVHTCTRTRRDKVEGEREGERVGRQVGKMRSAGGGTNKRH